MSEVSLKRFNELIHPEDPQPLTTLRDQARRGDIPGAFKRGPKKWFIDMSVYNREKCNRFTHSDVHQPVSDDAEEIEERAFIQALNEKLRLQ